MADEFMKGLSLSMVGALGWFIFAGWYRTPEYYAIQQLTVQAPEPNNVYQAIGIFASDAFLWLMILGPVTYWILIPIFRELRRSMTEEASG
jgi:hypothetical protein